MGTCCIPMWWPSKEDGSSLSPANWRVTSRAMSWGRAICAPNSAKWAKTSRPHLPRLGRPSIITGQKLGQNHRFHTWPDGLTDVLVPQRLVAKKGAQRCVEAVLTLHSPLQLYDVSGVGAAFFANVFLPR